MNLMPMILVLVSSTSLSTTQRNLIRHVEERLLAPCCYRQSIALHGSDIAEQMREEVTDMVAEGESEEEIVRHYRSLYGDSILIVPDGVTGRILFDFPIVASVLALLVVTAIARRMLGASPKQSPPVADGIDKLLCERIEREIGEEF
ncbi:MAG TPA: cytochrome c-type biogenesis protein CcmH [Candidatus Sulfotelmatobacter sp.]|nr:cytochrome c-type biogenesis protein CcmH [Candidatus Sulfotelmatobacter sp.]